MGPHEPKKVMKCPLRLVVWVSLLVLSCVIAALPHAHAGADNEATLSVLLSSDKKEYSLKEEIRWDARLLNSGTAPLTVFGHLRWGYGAGLTIHISDSAGQDVPPKYLDDDMILPTEADDRCSYVVLPPGHYLGATRPDHVSNLVQKPGTYFVYVEYKIPLPKKYGKGPNFWSREKPAVVSNRVEIDVRN
ncbi:MAG TPA: hypothetical protein VGR58_03460 [Candidatus Acidoferrum sp.]|nr:hypothetical protein [Candidatus Acidoferrum sp.]